MSPSSSRPQDAFRIPKPSPAPVEPVEDPGPPQVESLFPACGFLDCDGRCSECDNQAREDRAIDRADSIRKGEW